MAETFLILLAGGIMLAAAISDANDVTLHWLRLCGILALVMTGLSAFFLFRAGAGIGAGVPGIAWAVNGCVVAAIAAQLALAQLAMRRAQRVFAWLAFFSAVLVGYGYLAAIREGFVTPWLSALGVAAMTGLSLMDMLLGHAYLTASKMTIAPFRRLNGALGVALAARAALAVAGVLVLQHFRPVYMLWGAFGLLIFTRWLVGLAVPAVFVYMAHDCIRRRSTQSATGILYVAGVLVFIGELIAVYLVRTTGLPF
jgi:hypothetical protein